MKYLTFYSSAEVDLVLCKYLNIQYQFVQLYWFSYNLFDFELDFALTFQSLIIL